MTDKMTLREAVESVDELSSDEHVLLYPVRIKEHEVCRSLLKAVPDGYEWTGEYRQAKCDDWILGTDGKPGQWNGRSLSDNKYFILTPIQPPAPERKFKDGEFMRREPNVIWQITGARYECDRWIYKLKTLNDYVFELEEDDLEPETSSWQPQQGEWCKRQNGDRVLVGSFVKPDTPLGSDVILVINEGASRPVLTCLSDLTPDGWERP